MACLGVKMDLLNVFCILVSNVCVEMISIVVVVSFSNILFFLIFIRMLGLDLLLGVIKFWLYFNVLISLLILRFCGCNDCLLCLLVIWI